MALRFHCGRVQTAVRICEANGVPILMTVPLRGYTHPMPDIVAFEGPWSGMDPYPVDRQRVWVKPPTLIDRILFDTNPTRLLGYHSRMVRWAPYVTHIASQVEQAPEVTHVEVHPKMFSVGGGKGPTTCTPAQVVTWAEMILERHGVAHPLLLDTGHLNEFGDVPHSHLYDLTWYAHPTVHFQTSRTCWEAQDFLRGKLTPSVHYLLEILRNFATRSVAQVHIVIEQTPLHGGMINAARHPKHWLTAEGAAQFQVQVAQILQTHISALNL